MTKEKELSEGERWLKQNQILIRGSDRIVTKISRELSISRNGSYVISKKDLTEMAAADSTMFSWVMRVLSLTYTDHDWVVDEDPSVGTYTISWTQR